MKKYSFLLLLIGLPIHAQTNPSPTPQALRQQCMTLINTQQADATETLVAPYITGDYVAGEGLTPAQQLNNTGIIFTGKALRIKQGEQAAHAYFVLKKAYSQAAASSTRLKNPAQAEQDSAADVGIDGSFTRKCVHVYYQVLARTASNAQVMSLMASATYPISVLAAEHLGGFPGGERGAYDPSSDTPANAAAFYTKLQNLLPLTTRTAPEYTYLGDQITKAKNRTQ